MVNSRDTQTRAMDRTIAPVDACSPGRPNNDGM
jgi:hypothetical protein